MYIDTNEISEYPFFGEFYRVVEDVNAPLIEQHEKEVVVLRTPCDIIEGGSKRGQFITASFSIYFPFEDNVDVRRGDFFRGELYSMQVNGRVIGVFPTQLKGCVVYIDDLDI